MVKIIEKRDDPDKPENAKHVEYYVHYEAFNRRLDTWVSLMDFDLGTLEKPRTKEVADAQPSKEDGEKDPKKKKQKRENNEKNDVKVENDGVAAENKMKGHGGGHGNAHPDPEHAEFDPRALQEHEEFTKVRNILSIELGNHEMDTWYFSPFPPEYNGTKKLYFCEYTLAFFKRKEQLQRHLKKCTVQHPPGEEIYQTERFPSLKSMGRSTKCFVKIYVIWPSCFWITRRCITTSICFCFTSCANGTREDTTSSGTFPRRSVRRKGITWRVF